MIQDLFFANNYDGPPVPDGPPSEAESIATLFKIKTGKAPGPTGIRVEDMPIRHQKAYKKDPRDEDTNMWEDLCQLIVRCFRGEITTTFALGIILFIPNSDPAGFRGIGLLEVIRKMISQIINMRLTSTIHFDDAVHSFRRSRGTYTAISEAKLRIQLTMRDTKPHFQVYLDLKKAYDTLTRNTTMKTLE